MLAGWRSCTSCVEGGTRAQRAYATFRLRKKRRHPGGQERLVVIAEYTQLGSGFSIALRDLEMRGAGDLLGTRQHGYMAAEGFLLYTRMLVGGVRDCGRRWDCLAPR